MKKAIRGVVLTLVIALLLSAFAVYLVYMDRQSRLSQPETAPSTEAVISRPAQTEATGQETTEPTEEQTAPPEPFTVTASQVVVADGLTGEILYTKDSGYQKVYPASVTKLFTAYVALQHLSPYQVITAGKELEFVEKDSSVAFILEEQQLTTTMLIEGLLMCSGNDAAYILATAAGREIAQKWSLSPARAVEVFVEEMNRQAQELGLHDTHFMNPDGYHMGGHYTSLEDLVRIAQLAMDTPTIARCVMINKKDMVFVSGETITWSNTNLLINPRSKYYMPNACGLKTGHTDQGGYCLLSAFRQINGYLIVGVFGSLTSDDRFEDTITLAKFFG